MKRFIFTQFAFGVAILGVVSVMQYTIWGIWGMVAYILFASLCLTPAILKARSILRKEKGGAK